MILLHPKPEAYHYCPHCKEDLAVVDWYIPGMRTLAKLTCKRCDKMFFCDLPAGHGRYTPSLLDTITGEVFSDGAPTWHDSWLKQSYKKKNCFPPLQIHKETFTKVEKPILLNCLDMMYGHCLLKLLNAQYYLDNKPEYDLIVLIPSFLRWMVPDGVAAVWSVDLKLENGDQWNDGFAQAIKSELVEFDKVWLSVAYSHPHSHDFDIERFTRTKPFNLSDWNRKRPTVTYIWRNDRRWLQNECNNSFADIIQKIACRLQSVESRIETVQRLTVIRLAQCLRHSISDVEFAVAGIGSSEKLPSWIKDMRSEHINDDIEKLWCQQYASSHVVIGVHGSNMLLPSGHAATTIELMPVARWGNIMQDILSGEEDARMRCYLTRILPDISTPSIVASVVESLFKGLPQMRLRFSRGTTTHKRL